MIAHLHFCSEHTYLRWLTYLTVYFTWLVKLLGLLYITFCDDLAFTELISLSDKQYDPTKLIPEPLSEDKRSKSVGHNLPTVTENAEGQPLLSGESTSSNIFLPNVHNVKHNVSEKMAQVIIT